MKQQWKARKTELLWKKSVWWNVWGKMKTWQIC